MYEFLFFNLGKHFRNFNYDLSVFQITSSQLYKSLEFLSVCGPTYDSLPPFQWSKSDYKKDVPHAGHPDLWMFKPIVHKWSA